MEGKTTILLVEDESSIRRLAQRMLELDGHRVIEAASVRAALAAAAGQSLHLVITDYKLPDRSGEELLADLRVQQPGLPAVIMSGFGSDILEAPPTEAHRTLFLPKPFGRESLREVIQAALAP